MRPVIYYLKHLLQDMDEEKMLSRAGGPSFRGEFSRAKPLNQSFYDPLGLA